MTDVVQIQSPIDIDKVRRTLKPNSEAAVAFERLVSYNEATRFILNQCVGVAFTAYKDELHARFKDLEHQLTAMQDGVLRVHNRLDILVERASPPTMIPRVKFKKHRRGKK